MHLLNEALESYASQHSSEESATLKSLVRETTQKALHHRMLSGHLQGRVLSMISRMLKPARILEVGTFTGYSAICLAEGLTDEGLLVTIDINDELDWIRQKYFAESGYQNCIQQVHGEGLATIGNLNESWDLVFVDADKAAYPDYYTSIMPQLKAGGWMIFDNVLWSGKVIDDTAHDADTTALRTLNDRVQQDPRCRNVLLPLRDGLMILEKVSD